MLLTCVRSEDDSSRSRRICSFASSILAFSCSNVSSEACRLSSSRRKSLLAAA